MRRRLDFLRKFTKPKRTEELKGAIAAAKAEMLARAELVHLVKNHRARALEQLKSCSIKAPTSGTVFLNALQPGSIVHVGQVLLFPEEE